MSESLFAATSPLAARMRPRSIEEIVGQTSALALGSPLRVLATPGSSSVNNSVLLWGPPGTGKTTIARVVAASSGRRLIELSAITTSVKELREVIDKARTDQELYSVATVVFLDEIHRFSKAQQDSLLPAVEAGWIVLIAATTENPSFSVIAPLLSRSLLVRLEPLSSEEIRELLIRAVEDPRGLNSRFELQQPALEQIISVSGGDARRAFTVLEAAANHKLAMETDSSIAIDDVLASMELSMVKYDRDGDNHYDTISAFIKSVRGSDPDAAIHYLARMLEGGEDPRFIARRLIILAAEDIGLADPGALTLAVSCFEAVNLIGMPEGRIPLAETSVYLSLAPKSNSSYLAINQALEDVRKGFQPPIPNFLRSSSLSRAGDGSYRYPHDEPHSVVRQNYLSEPRDYYQPKQLGAEGEIGLRWKKLRSIIRGEEA